MQVSPRVLRYPRHRVSVALSALALCVFALIPGAARASAQPLADAQPSTALWPKFSTPKTLLVANTQGLSSVDRLTVTTLQGIYNGSQQSSRLYLRSGTQDDFWLTQLPAGVQVQSIDPTPSQSLVQTLLARFRSVVHGAVVTNPSNPDTVNLATTMAGIDHAVVIDPSQQAMADALGIKVIYSFDTSDFDGVDPVKTYEWGVSHLLAQTSTRMLDMVTGTIPGGSRDYAVATRSFVFSLTSDKADQKALLTQILAHVSANTPILGYVPDENPDVAYLSSLGHFLNGSTNSNNLTVWAAMPSPNKLVQPSEAAPIAVKANTVYVAFLVSDGDNLDYMQGTMAQQWQGPDLGAVPEGWTDAPAAAQIAPTWLKYYYAHLPNNSELVAGPSGIGYATQMTGSDLSEFARLTGQMMRQQDLHSIDSFERQDYLPQFAKDSGVANIASQNPMAEQQMGATVAMGQASGYVPTAAGLFDSINQQSATIKPGKPLFLEPLVDAWTLNATDVLHIAQQLTLAGQRSGIHYVFTTPTELALTMKHYYAGQEVGLPAANQQSMTGEQTLTKPIIAPPFPSAPTTVTGPNLVDNPSGASGTTGWSVDKLPWITANSSVSATTYQGQPALHWTTSDNNGPDWVHYYPLVTNGQTYKFDVDAAGSGQVFMDVYASRDWETLPVKLTSSFQHLTWTVTIPSNAPGGQTGGAPQLQLRSSGAGPLSVYFTNASVAAVTPAS
jgi:hypothetical protein